MAVAGKGTEFRRWDPTGGGSVGAWEKIAEVNSISGPSMSRDMIETTSLDTTGGYRTYIGGFRNPGTIGLSMNFRRDTYETMKSDFESDVVKNYEIVLPDADNTSLEFEGLVSELPLEISPDDKITTDITIQISGKPVLNSGSGSGA
jgi:predicted secreted protein